MNPHPRIAAYLDAVTGTLTGDDELRLDVRAELAAHLDDATARFQAEGRTPDESAELALQALGPATDYAGDLVAANRGRMRLRSRIRLLLRALLVPAAMVAALVSLGGCTTAVVLGRMMCGQGDAILASDDHSRFGHATRWLKQRLAPDRHLTPEQRLILHGDLTRSDAVAGQRAIWEAWPTNAVYLNNYLGILFSRYDTLGKTPAERLTALNRELDPAIALDPENARYLYLRADKRLELGAKIETIDLGKNERSEGRSDYRLIVHDRAALDAAMADLLAGTRKPALRRYSGDMLRERLTLMGPPDSLLEQIARVGMAAGVLLPDLSTYRNLTRASLAYARLLIEEGRPDEAHPFIDAWQPLCVQVTGDSFTLIDILVAGAIARMGQTNATALYQEMGDSAAAERTRQAAAALAAPVQAYRARVKNPDSQQEQMIRQRAGALTAILLPALGEMVKEEELEAGRMVEYVLMDQSTAGVTSLILCAIMFAALLIALRWRFIRGGAGAPLLLLPDTHQSLRILGYGVILPLAAYFVWTRLPALGCRDLALGAVWPVAAAQAVTLVAAIAVTTVTLAARAIRARCDTLQVAAPPAARRQWLLWALAAGGATLLLLAQGLYGALAAALGTADRRSIFGFGLALFSAALILAAGTVFVRALLGSPRYGLYRGTLARSLIPHLALAVVLVTVLTKPYLRTAEASLIRTDTLIATPPGETSAGFTAIEVRLTQRLRAAMLNAVGK